MDLCRGVDPKMSEASTDVCDCCITSRARGVLRRLANGAVLVLSVWLLCAARVHAQTSLPCFNLQFTTDRGCVETGQNPIFVVGEPVKITFRIGSGVVSQASATIYDTLPNNLVRVFSLGQVPTNRTIGIIGLVGTPTGAHHLLLSADAQGVRRTRRSCTFTVVSGTPGNPTPTPTATRPPVTRTNTPPRTATRTAGPGGLNPKLFTNRGCLENGDNTVFAIGELIQVSFRVNSATRARANVSILDRAANGNQIILSFGSLLTNIGYQFVARVGPPTGTEILTLRASATGLADARAMCSFRVVTTPGATATRTPAMTPTHTATRIATHTKTPVVATPPRTPTRTPVPGCIGACTNPGEVTITDLMIVLQIAAGETSLSACPSADANGDGIVALVEILLAVSNALNGCPPGP